MNSLGLPSIQEESPSEGQSSTITKRFAKLGVISDHKSTQLQISSNKEETKGETHTGITPLMDRIDISGVSQSNIEPSAI